MPPADPGRSILLVDDDDFGRETLGRILEADGHRVLRAADGDEALSHLFGGERPGLIVLDLVLPVPGGCGFLRDGGEEALADVPVIAVTATDGRALREEIPGIVAHFEKPILVAALRAAIRQYLSA